MRPRGPSASKLLHDLVQPYVCSSCLLRAASQHHVPARSRRSLSLLYKPAKASRSTNGPKRYASNGSLASASAINAPSAVPPAYRELHRRLLDLQEAAGGFVDLARLQLAARSLESANPVLRVALLGLGSNGPLAARKLARVTLSDALEQEEAWEGELVRGTAEGGSLLLKYGDAQDNVQTSSIVHTMTVPSPFLRRQNLEILVSTLNVDAESTDQTAFGDAMLVPSLTIPTSAHGRFGFVRFPVHRAVVVADGVEGAMAFGAVRSTFARNDLVTAALCLPIRDTSNLLTNVTEFATPVDIDLANHALSLFRSNMANGAKFSTEWQTSGVSAIMDWLSRAERSDYTSTGLDPTVKSVVLSLLSTTSTSISQFEAARTAIASTATVPDSERSVLESAITSWSAEAHRDLQSNLDTAFKTSRFWKRTAWWRLFWRIDDVSISTSDVLRRHWLTEAEQSLAFLSGRILESGLATVEQLKEASAVKLLDERDKGRMERYENAKSEKETLAELLQMPSMLSRMQQRSGVNPLFDPPWPQTINLSRQYMLHTLVPALHRKAQALLFTSLSTIGGSAALAVWFYVATAGIAVYESGALAALGLVWALRSLQKKWSKERDDFASTVREDGRKVLRELEANLRQMVRDGGRATVRPEDARSWHDAREAVERCRQAVEKLSE